MAWTDERIDQLKTMWEKGLTASQIAEELGGVSRNAVIGKAHRLGLQARPSPVKEKDTKAPVVADIQSGETPDALAAPFATDSNEAEPSPAEIAAVEDEAEEAEEDANETAAEVRAAQPQFRSIGPGGFVRQTPGEQQPPATPAPPRRLVPARPGADMAGKTSLLELNDRICKWPIGHPGEPDFHFCGEPANPGFPYCVDHCSSAYQAQIPRRDRRAPPPLPFGGPRR
ncbi:GcrA cell cycle regulator [Sphingomonas jejuensis]|uniref:GcrA cell cycle regulator n=1 Tax=Sphingomonas jejuensis TaxID=904715 RepID=A0ABX0XI64_9SPHN|nr:GcrA family cell cycle regulator [Sphingomonas jejuensis]NJC33026.1 GcrA cell cycle regulator [Sphingomonas jejuensis]